jgi:hypothetical protein
VPNETKEKRNESKVTMRSIAISRHQACVGQVKKEVLEKRRSQGCPKGLRQLTCEVTGVDAARRWAWGGV